MHNARDLGQVIVVSGGSGYNNLVGATPSAIFVLPGTQYMLWLDQLTLLKFQTMAVCVDSWSAGLIHIFSCFRGVGYTSWSGSSSGTSFIQNTLMQKLFV